MGGTRSWSVNRALPLTPRTVMKLLAERKARSTTVSQGLDTFSKGNIHSCKAAKRVQVSGKFCSDLTLNCILMYIKVMRRNVGNGGPLDLVEFAQNVLCGVSTDCKMEKI